MANVNRHLSKPEPSFWDGWQDAMGAEQLELLDRKQVVTGLGSYLDKAVPLYGVAR